MQFLVYGGSGSGKSYFAESLLTQTGTRPESGLYYIATMFPGDAEARRRIARHQAERQHKGFLTFERYTDLEGLEVPAGACVLLECLGNLVANEMFLPGGAGAKTESTVLRGLEKLAGNAADFVVVSNDVFSDGVDYAPETREYCRVLAALHRALARDSSVVVETVCGIPVYRKNISGVENGRKT